MAMKCADESSHESISIEILSSISDLMGLFHLHGTEIRNREVGCSLFWGAESANEKDLLSRIFAYWCIAEGNHILPLTLKCIDDMHWEDTSLYAGLTYLKEVKKTAACRIGPRIALNGKIMRQQTPLVPIKTKHAILDGLVALNLEKDVICGECAMKPAALRAVIGLEYLLASHYFGPIRSYEITFDDRGDYGIFPKKSYGPTAAFVFIGNFVKAVGSNWTVCGQLSERIGNHYLCSSASISVVRAF
jgi:hypothetical protein